jgi:chromosome segregation protein
MAASFSMPTRLKSLELHGYKTFANRTLFEFAETVTAIVGPNGSGKSNIADSLRWVLGEQSYSLLRGKKTEDMIFAGSESRARAGMASATITFDNSDGWLPIDFSEVAITRRAYRDGLNEYLINGQRVRLRDVSELLAQSGLAERTYTIIGQGLVDAALSLKADERRRLFEEAAGIGLHRSRREEALRRLDTTRRNLERVQDILAELKPRLASLERQARRSQEYEQLRADLQEMLREWYGYHWQVTQRELAEAQQLAQTQEARLEQARNEVAALEQRLAESRQRLSAAREQLSQWRKALSALHSQRELIQRDLAVSEERRHSLLIQKENTVGELARLAEELAYHQEQRLAGEAELERLQAELQEAQSQKDAVDRQLAARQEERSKIERMIAAQRQEIGQLNTRYGQAQAQLAENQAQSARAQKSLEAALQAQAKADEELRAAVKKLEQARQAVEKAAQARQAAEESAQAHKQQVEQADAARRQAQEQRSALAAELARIQAQLNVLHQAESALAGYAAGTQAILKAVHQQRLSGARGALSSFLEVPAELERAISAALGEYLDAVVLQDDLETALDILQREAGRGVLLPVNALRPLRQPLVLNSKDEGILGVASSLVAAPAELRPALELLLGQVLIVRDRDAARRALENQPGDVRAATLAGEVFHASGPITGGGGGEDGKQQTLLGRNRQQRQLTAESQRLEHELSLAVERLTTLEAELERLRRVGKQLEQAQEEALQEWQKAARAADQARLAVEAAERQMQWTKEQHQRLQSDFNRSQSEAERLTKEIGEIEDRLDSARRSLRQSNFKLEALSLDEIQTQIAHWSTRVAVAQSALANEQARRQERLSNLERVSRNQITLQERQKELEIALVTLEQQRAEWTQKADQIEAAVQELNARIEPAEMELRQLEAEQTELQRVETVARQALSFAEHNHAQARIALARRHEAMQSLQRRIEEDFGLVAFEYEGQVSGPTPLPLAGMVEQLPTIHKLSPDIEENIKRQRAQLRRLGAINPEAQIEYQEVKQRYQFLTDQVADLQRAEQDIRQVIAELDDLMEREFRRTFDSVADEFRQIFIRLFGGGSARLILTEPDDLTATGIEIQARLPGRREQGLALLSGGERSLTATALVFSLLKVSPTPFCVLDEVDAMLDEANVSRFRELLRELSQTTQFVIITHNRNTVQVADVIYGVTMGRDSASQVLSLKLDEVSQVVES